MRKFLMAAALLAVAACGDKGAKAGDSTGAAAPAPTMAPTMAPMTAADSAHADSVKKDSMMKAGDTTKMAPAKP
ncbi:MAG TPA: hypothetical protein VGM77_01080 [Gemmatimonadales bacterium]|jgi:hypothetical protein